MGILNLPVRRETCLRSLLWFALQLMLLLRLRLMPRLMLDFSMEDMDMVLVWDMLVLAMLDTDMVLVPMDTLDLDITARDLLMLSLRLRLMLMLDFSMGDMDMVLVWDMLVLDIEVLAMLDTDMVSQLMDTPDLDITARDLLMLKLSLKQRLMLDFSMEDMDMVLVLDMQV